MKKKILILTTQPGYIELYNRGEVASHSNWGMIELRDTYDAKIVPIGNTNILCNTKILIKEDFDILFMHNVNPARFLPVHILRMLFPSLRHKKIIALSHASIFGKGDCLMGRFGQAISWFYKGYDKLLFFSPKSMIESVSAGINSSICQTIHWGADRKFVANHIEGISNGNYWLSTGKELRDFAVMEKASEIVDSPNAIKIVKGGLSYAQILKITSNSKGILVIPNKAGLKYCTGLTCVMDAFACSKPIISVRNPYFPFDLEKEGCGIYVNPESPNEIAAAIRTIESDSALYERMCQNSMRMAESYNMEIYKNELFEIIDEI